MAGEDAYELLFGRTGRILSAGKGTVQINFIENLDFRSQKKLLEILMFRNVIAVAKTRALRERLLPELYERLRPFAIEIPALDETPEDIPLLVRDYVTMLAERYGRFHVLSKEAEQLLTKLRWPGNRIQLESFLERLILCARKRSIGAEEIRTLYTELYGDAAGAEPCSQKSGAQQPMPMSSAEPAGLRSTDELRGTEKLEREQLVQSLARNFGNRGKTAEELGISKTTLWRKLKQYRLL